MVHETLERFLDAKHATVCNKCGEEEWYTGCWQASAQLGIYTWIGGKCDQVTAGVREE